jgi:hypothetical protein
MSPNYYCNLTFTPPQTDCGSGICNPITNTCQCNVNYVNYGDFNMVQGGPCTVLTPVVITLWAFVVLLCVLGILTAIWGLRIRLRIRGAMTLKAIRASWRVWTIPVATSLLCFFTLPIALGKIIDPEHWIVSLDSTTTILYCISLFLTVVALISTALGILKASMNESLVAMGSGTSSSFTKMFMKRYRLTKRVLYISVAISLGSCLTPLALLSYPHDRDAQRKIIAVHGMGIALICFIAGVLVVPPFLSSMIHHLNESQSLAGISPEGVALLQTVKLKMQVAWVLSFIGFGCQSILISIFCLWPYLTLSGAYFIPMEYNCVLVACIAAIWITTTSKRRLGGIISTTNMKGGESNSSYQLSPNKRNNRQSLVDGGNNNTHNTHNKGESSLLLLASPSPVVNLTSES